MALLGEHAWWMPGWLEPLVPNLQLEGSAPVAAAPPAPPPKAAM
jgi:RND superfamily putative drug exporter